LPLQEQQIIEDMINVLLVKQISKEQEAGKQKKRNG
jgi:hypothetical protein